MLRTAYRYVGNRRLASLASSLWLALPTAATPLMPFARLAMVPLAAGRLVILGLAAVTSTPAVAAESAATPVSAISVMPGFEVELLRSALPGEGSWISLTFDPQGRIILADDTQGLKRLTLADDPAQQAVIEPLAGTETLQHCRGVLYAHDSIYVCETNGQGIHRLRDHDGDGLYEDRQLIVPLVYRSRYGHGANQLRLGPDGMIYASIGNDVFYPEDIDADSPYQRTDNDWMLPNRHDGEADPRSGFILKLSPDGQQRTVLCGGLRNQVDVDFNSDGEMFTWDADMEWDLGLPWYRPTRVNHIVAGGEYGWRWGTGKWPDWFPDSLPSNLDTALGSPAGIAFGTPSDWPDRFREAMYGADWQHGRLLLIEWDEVGASYQGRYQVLAEGSPLNICDLEFGPDGQLYFITGGRGSQSGLYRVRYLGGLDVDATPPTKTAAAAAARQLRRQLESLQGPTPLDEQQLTLIWQNLGSDDQWLRYAARAALERQPTDRWLNRIAQEPDPFTQLTALMALARCGTPQTQPLILDGLLPHLQPTSLDAGDDLDGGQEAGERLLLTLRTLQLTLIRDGLPPQPAQREILTALHQLPAVDRYPVNWLTGELLVALDSPQAVPRLVACLQAAATQEEQIQYMKTLVHASRGWTDESRSVARQWLLDNRRLPGGRLVATQLTQLRDDFLAMLSAKEKIGFADALQQLASAVADDPPQAVAVDRPLVRPWTLDELSAELDALAVQPHDAAAGARYLAEALCLRCHRFGDSGSPIGPDLTNVGKRFDRRTLLESILLPSAQIDAKFSNAIYVLDDGRVISGRAAQVSRDQLTVEVDQLTGHSVVIRRGQIVQSRQSDLSPMPSGLLDHFTAAEIADLIAYLRQDY